MNGERAQVNGQHVPNGAHVVHQTGATELKGTKALPPLQHGLAGDVVDSAPYTNGILSSPAEIPISHGMANGLDQAPLEILQLIQKDSYLPMASLISRSAQSCWDSLGLLVDQLAHISIPEQSQDLNTPLPSYLSNGVLANNQTKANLDKKDRILNFANDQKAKFVKLLVLLQWSKDVDDVTKTIELNFWLTERRRSYWDATHALALLKNDASGFQIPDPDIKTAGEVLALGKVPSFPDLGYRPSKALSNREILTTLESLNQILCVRLALDTELPPPLHIFTVHDGRATFAVPEEFELDLSLLDESPSSQFRVVDFRFTFSPSRPLSDKLYSEIEFIANSIIDQEGLTGCYKFFHDLTLSHKLSELHKQASHLALNQWAGHLKVELLRRNLVVQYWPERTIKKSWIEIGIQSGRSRATAEGDPNPFLQLRWIREGNEVQDLEFELDLSSLSFERILYQIIARHSICVLDAIYDGLLITPLFADGNLSVEEATSSVEPEDCSLEIQMSRRRFITSRIDPVTGLFILSPVSEKSEHLQHEINRSKSVVDNFITKVLYFRCVMAEADVLGSMSNTIWQHLRAFKPTTTEIRGVLGGAITRSNFFRQPYWSRDYLMAVTYGANGDCWWLLQQGAVEGQHSFSSSQLINTQALLHDCELSPSYFEDFADYTSGMIVLQSNTSQLNGMLLKYSISAMPAFETGYVLPTLSFELEGETPVSLEVDYVSVDPISKLARISVKFHSKANPSVLERLAISNPDSSIKFAPKQGHIKLEITSPVGVSAVSDIILRVNRLNDLIACIEKVQTLSIMTLVELSMTAMSLSYRLPDSPDLQLNVQFATAQAPPQLEFLPADTNPHVYLAPQLTRLLRNRQESFATNLNNVLASLTITHPLVSHLHQLQKTSLSMTPDSDRSKVASIVLHVLVRQPTMFAIQFFTPAAHLPRDSLGQESHPQLLARFEILPQVQHGRNMWLIRPAIEEFQTYVRPSYSSQPLRVRLKEEIFARRESRPDWLCLDTAAVCLADRPQPLLEALKGVLNTWVQETASPASDDAAKPEAVRKQEPKQGPVPPKAVAGKPPGQAPITNGINNQPKGRAGTGKPPQAPMKRQEVITLD